MSRHTDIFTLPGGRTQHGERGEIQTLLGRFAAARAGEGVQVVLAFIPMLRDAEAKSGKTRARLIREFRAWAASHPNIEIIDIYPALEGLVGLEDRIFFGDSHPNTSAHRLFATAIYLQLVPLLERRSQRTTD